MASVNDDIDAWLRGNGYTVGSLSDRYMAHLFDSTGVVGSLSNRRSQRVADQLGGDLNTPSYIDRLVSLGGLSPQDISRQSTFFMG